MKTMENDMKKIGVVTLHGNFNMGNKLQNYAVMQLYRSLGCDVVNICHLEWQMRPNQTPVELLKGVLKETLPFLCPNLHPKLRRRRLFMEFSADYLSPSETVSMRRLPPDLKERYDFFSVGSDQVWHNWSGRPEGWDFFFLKFADRRQRLCLSPSFGFQHVQEDEVDIDREGLNGFARLSCREASGVELIRSLTGQEAVLLADPTMCLSVEEWERLERKPAYPLPERYVLSYMLSELQPETMEAVSRYARLLGLETVNINDMLRWTDKRYYVATGPREFLYLIRHASLVCTNSFHGIVFSVLFRRNFVCFRRDDSSITGDMSDRVTTLLDKFHLTTRCHGVLSDGDLLSTDYAGTEGTLSQERERVLEYLRGTLARHGEKREGDFGIE